MISPISTPAVMPRPASVSNSQNTDVQFSGQDKGKLRRRLAAGAMLVGLGTVGLAGHNYVETDRAYDGNFNMAIEGVKVPTLDSPSPFKIDEAQAEAIDEVSNNLFWGGGIATLLGIIGIKVGQKKD